MRAQTPALLDGGVQQDPETLSLSLTVSDSQISAEEIKDNRVVLFEMEARKLDNKVGR